MATAMFQKLRLTNSKTTPATSLPNRRDSILPSHNGPPSGPPNAASFLGLPPELRNTIYDFLARDTTVTLALTKRRSKRPHPICGLLLVSKQMYHEYRPLLLASARISIPVAEFDFGSIIKALKELPQDDLHALAANKRFYLTLLMAHALKHTELEGLAAWLGYRAEAEQDKDDTTSQHLTLRALHLRYDAKIDPSRSMVSRQNMRVALLTALIRKIATLGGHSKLTVEKRRMMRDLMRCKDDLMGLERREDDALEKDIALTTSTVHSPFFGVQGYGANEMPVDGY